MPRTSLFDSGPMTTWSLRVPRGVKDGFKRLARELGQDVSAVARPVLVDHLEKNSEKREGKKR